MPFATTDLAKTRLNPVRIDFTLSRDIRVSGFSTVASGSGLLDFYWDREKCRLFVTLLDELAATAADRSLCEDLHTLSRSFLCGASRRSKLPLFDACLSRCGARASDCLALGLMLEPNRGRAYYSSLGGRCFTVAAARQQATVINNPVGEPTGCRSLIDIRASRCFVAFSQRLAELVPVASLAVSAFHGGVFDAPELQERILQTLDNRSLASSNFLLLTVVNPPRTCRSPLRGVHHGGADAHPLPDGNAQGVNPLCL
jgi:hypothetical protein